MDFAHVQVVAYVEDRAAMFSGRPREFLKDL
jgi:hypothetical protein